MNPISFLSRLAATIIDKVIVIILFVIFSIIYYSPFESSSKLGTYSALIGDSPSSYEYIDNMKVGVTPTSSLYYKKDVQTVELKKGNNALLLDLELTGFFIAINFIYYFLFELLLKASLGKYLLGGIIFTNKKSIISIKKCFLRSLLLLILMLSMVGLRFALNVSYYHVIILFFIILDASVFFDKRSLIDILTKTYIIKRI